MSFRSYSPQVCRPHAGLPLAFALALWAGTTLGATAASASVPPDHQRPLLTPAEEAAWLAQLVDESPHRRMLAEAQALGLLPPAEPANLSNALPFVPPPPSQAQPAKPGRQVLGYLPYWTMKTAVLPWDQLTQLGYFSAGLNGNATIGTTQNWGGANAKALVAEAHSHGVQVVLTITQFDSASISQILSTAATRTKAVSAIVDLVIAGGGDGVNIDFEGLPKADRDKMNAFIAELTTAFHTQLPNSDVTLATPAVDWSGAWDYQYLAEHSDGLMVMAYGLHWTGGDPGPNLPMGAKSPWKHKTLQWIIDDYIAYAKPQNTHKLRIGLPLYGQQWLANSDKTGAAKVAKGNSIFFDNGMTLAESLGGWQWDDASQSSWVVEKQSPCSVSGAATCWLQTWSDNLQAFQLRADYLDQRDVHMGLWALGYTDKHPQVFEIIDAWQAKGDPVVADPGPDVSSDVGPDTIDTPDIPAEVVVDITPDVAPDLPPDADDVTQPDAVPDLPPDAPQDVAPDGPKDATATADGGEGDNPFRYWPDIVKDTAPNVKIVYVAAPGGCSAGSPGGTTAGYGAGLLLLAFALRRRRAPGPSRR
ncbi:MAG: glycosyl hydrolase family 18 protein [Myxococcota bacterium]